MKGIIVSLFIGLILSLFAGCSSAPGKSSGSGSKLQADYTDCVSKVAPSLKLKLKSMNYLSTKGVTDPGSPVLNAITNDSALMRAWVGWDNDRGGIYSPAGKDGWMPYIEDETNAWYIDNINNAGFSTNYAPDGEPDLKTYAILNKVFFGSGSDTIYGSAQFLDMMINNLNQILNGLKLSPKTVLLPAWFGNVYTDDATQTNILELDNIRAYSNLSPDQPFMSIGFRLVPGTGEQDIILYMVFSGSVSLYYARKDSANHLYIKSVFANFDSGQKWIYSHIAEIRTSGSDYIVRKANKIWGDGSGAAPLGTVYSHALVGGGSIASDKFSVLRWCELKYGYTNTLYTNDNQPILHDIRVDLNNPVNEIYFVVKFDAAAQYNARFIPLYGFNKTNNTPLPADLFDDPNMQTNYLVTMPECESYTHETNFFNQAEIAGWKGDTPASFPCWTVLP
jgi:hypothetical protein